MKIIKNTNLSKKQEVKYPYFGQDTEGTVILFIKENSGMCVNVGENDEDSVLFEYDYSWVEELFKPIPNYSITITTEE